MAGTKKKTAAKPATPKVKDPNQTQIVHGFKGFDKDLKCRGKQYALGETYEEESADLCSKGLHFCEDPLDCFGYYAPGSGSRYAIVAAENPSDQKDTDSKRVTKKLSIGGELSLAGIIEAAVKFRLERVTWSDSATNSGTWGAATNSGTWGAATNSGTEGAATNSGLRGAATNSGTWGAATNSGTEGAATNSGLRGAATNSGTEGAAFDNGYCGSSSTDADHSVAVSTGYKGKSRANIGSWIALVERKEDGEILDMRCAKVDGEILKADIFYTLKDGEFVEAEN